MEDASEIYVPSKRQTKQTYKLKEKVSHAKMKYTQEPAKFSGGPKSKRLGYLKSDNEESKGVPDDDSLSLHARSRKQSEDSYQSEREES